MDCPSFFALPASYDALAVTRSGFTVFFISGIILTAHFVADNTVTCSGLLARFFLGPCSHRPTASFSFFSFSFYSCRTRSKISNIVPSLLPHLSTLRPAGPTHCGLKPVTHSEIKLKRDTETVSCLFPTSSVIGISICMLKNMLMSLKRA